MNIAFAIWMLLIGGVPAQLGLEIYPSTTLGGILLYEHPGGSFDPPYQDEGADVLGLFQVHEFWLRALEKKGGRRFNRALVEDGELAESLAQATAVVAYFDERHERCERRGLLHTWGAHWTGNNDQRAAIDAGLEEPTISGIGRLEGRIAAARMWVLLWPLGLIIDIITEV